MSRRTATRCRECGGTSDGANVRGCRACCRDCGFPCGEQKDDEGFHMVEIDENYLQARRAAEEVDHERVVWIGGK